MPRLLSFQPNGVAVADLGYFAYRLDIGSTVSNGIPFFSFVYKIPPTGAMLALFRAPISIADNDAELNRVTSVSLDGGTLELDTARVKEAYQLFRNKDVRADALNKCIDDSIEVIKAYWAARDWLEAGAVEKKEFTALATKLMMLP